MPNVLAANIASGPLPYAVLAVAGCFVGFLATQSGLRRRQSLRRRVAGVTIAAVLGAVGGLVVYWIVAVLWNPFNIPMPRSLVLYCAALGVGVATAVLSTQRARWWRIVVSGVAVVSCATAATLAIVAAFGMNPTLGSLFGQSTTASAPHYVQSPHVPKVKPKTRLAESWKPPKNMPAAGQTRTIDIPPAHSGFVARAAGLYLPPAALTADPPKLPLMIFMMGQPGNPDPHYVANILDKFAAQNHGLAPIVVVADQLGSPDRDPGCSNSPRYGNVETYITVDVVDWARQHLNVDHSGATTTIGGYSNGGACAMLFAAKYSDDFANVVDISGELFPGAENPSRMLADVFGGDQSAYEAHKPLTVLQQRTYAGLGVFTSGSDDVAYVAAGKAAERGFADAGFVTQFAEIPNGGHVLGALNGGLEIAFSTLYPALGLQVAR